MSGWTKKDFDDWIDKFTMDAEAAVKRKPLPSYVPHFHSDKVIYAAIRAATPKNGVLWDWLNEQARQENHGVSETERGIVEGERRFCIRWIDIANSEDEPDAIS